MAEASVRGVPYCATCNSLLCTCGCSRCYKARGECACIGGFKSIRRPARPLFVQEYQVNYPDNSGVETDTVTLPRDFSASSIDRAREAVDQQRQDVDLMNDYTVFYNPGKVMTNHSYVRRHEVLARIRNALSRLDTLGPRYAATVLHDLMVELENRE